MSGRAGTPETPAPTGFARIVAESATEIERRILERLQRWVEHESPTGDESACTALAVDIGAALTGAGAAEVELIEAPGWGRHVRARIEGRERAAPHVVVLGHLDTVHPRGTLATQPFRTVDGRAEGPGVYDMKAGLAVMTEVFGVLHENAIPPRRPVTVLVTCDEEFGSDTSRTHIEAAARGAAAVLVLEPSLPGGAVKTRRKGVSIYKLIARGRAAHAGLEPEKGINAILELAHQMTHVSALAEPDRGTTVNIGVVHGGTASNVVPAEAWAEVDVRFTAAAEHRRVDRAIHALEPVTPGAQFTVEGGENRPPLERTDGVVALYHHARRLAAEIGFELGEGTAGGASDGNYTAAVGTPTLDGLGPIGGGAHSTEEHILIEDLSRRAALYGRLLETL